MSYQNRDNSYILWFARFAEEGTGSLRKWFHSFYGIKMAVSTRYRSLQNAGPLRNDRQIVLAALSCNADAFQYVSSTLRLDPALALKAVMPVLNAREEGAVTAYQIFEVPFPISL